MFIGQQSKTQIIQDYARYVNPGRASVFKQLGFDIVPGRREGVWVWDVDGDRKFVNCRCGEIFNLGHRPPRVVAALKAALDEVDVGDHLLMDELLFEERVHDDRCRASVLQTFYHVQVIDQRRCAGHQWVWQR